MSKYDPLWLHVKSDGRDTFKLSFDDIEKIIGFKLDHALLTYKKELPKYGYQVGKISLKEKYVTFNKVK